MAAGQDFDVEVLWNGPAQDTDYSRQIQIVDSMVARGVDGLAIAPVEKTALVLPIERAVKAGIPVTIYDSGLDSDVYMTFVATNNYKAGEMAGRKLAELLGGKGEVIMIMHMPGSAASMDREKAFADVIEKEFPGIKIVGKQYGMGDRAKVLAAAENLLTANPNVDGLFASAEACSVGASRALKARGLAGKVKFVAFDASDELIEDLKDATIDALRRPRPLSHRLRSGEVDSSETETARHPPERLISAPGSSPAGSRQAGSQSALIPRPGEVSQIDGSVPSRGKSPPSAALPNPSFLTRWRGEVREDPVSRRHALLVWLVSQSGRRSFGRRRRRTFAGAAWPARLSVLPKQAATSVQRPTGKLR